MNIFKTALLLSLLTALLLGAGFLMGGQSGLIVAFAFALAINFFSYWFSDKIVLAMYHAQPANSESAPRLFRIVENLTQKAGMPMPKVYIIPNAEAPNAFATGRNPSHAAVAVTNPLLEMMNDDELEGVIAHELSHIKNRDTLIATVAATMAGAISMLATMAHWALLFGGHNRDDDNNSSPFAAVGAILMMILAPIAAMLIQMAISRSREYLADKSGAKIAGTPLGLAKALFKLEMYAKERKFNASPATAHMFIVNPLRGKDIASLFRTHPSTEDRIERLRALNTKEEK
ncbi:MAG: zinc metalloprotease HtpX [Planctomycetes bacterium]|nr:zinc metalloprotease HtpX [Planctomycetota bacterium]